MDCSRQDVEEESARKLENQILSLCVIWIFLSIVLVSYDSLRDLFSGVNGSPGDGLLGFALPALAPAVRLVLKVFALMFYLAAWRIALKENSKAGRGLLIGFGVFYIVGVAAIAFVKTLIL